MFAFVNILLIGVFANSQYSIVILNLGLYMCPIRSNLLIMRFELSISPLNFVFLYSVSYERGKLTFPVR